MVQFFAEILRGVAYRNDNWKPVASNNPALVGDSGGFASVGAGVTATSDGDILSLSGTTATNGVQFQAAPVSTTSNPYLVVRGSGSGTIDVLVTFTSGSQTITVTLPSTTTTQSFSLTTGKTVQTYKLLNQSVGGTNLFDRIAFCSKTPVQISQKDLKNGTVTRTSLGNDHAELELANYRGKYTASIFGSGGTNAIGFGDHIHIYMGQGSTLYHVYGGYAEYQEPVQPPDNILIHSRGFGLALLRSKVLQIYNNQTPQAILNDELDNFVNPTNKNGLGIASNYQLTRSYVQAIGSSIPLYVASLNNAFNTFHELSDLTVFQGTPAIFFVDPAENLHWVPLLSQGGGGGTWNTDPFSALNSTGLAYGTSLSTSNLSRDTQSLANRVHYYGIAQVPGQVDGITEYSTNGAMQADWDTERLNTDTVATLSTVGSPVAIGSKSNDFTFSTGGGAGGNAFLGAAIYPKTHSSTFIDFTKLGSQWSPPVVEFYFRVHPTAPATYGMRFSTLYFANDASNRYEYRLTNNPNGTNNSILNIDTPANDLWYHILVPVGPNAGNLFLSAPTPNMVAQPTLLTPPYQNIVGAPVWSTIKYLGVYNGGTDATDTQPASACDVYLDGFRIVGGRYRLAYDNRTVANGRYPDMSEAYYYDPISKDETAIKGFAASELSKLRNGILRGSVTGPLRADIVPEQQIQITDPSANLSSQYLRCTSVIHHFSPNGFITELALTDDFTNARPLDKWKLMNALLEMGENAIFSRQVYDLRSAVLDPTFSPLLDPY